jgi:hypothetical protein
MTTTTERPTRLLPTLAERVPRSCRPATDEAVTDVLQVLPPLVAGDVEMAHREQRNARAKVDWQGSKSGPRGPSLDRTSQPGSGQGLGRSAQTAGYPSILVADAVELLHGCVMTLRHVMKVFFRDIHHFVSPLTAISMFFVSTSRRLKSTCSTFLIAQGPTEDSLGTGRHKPTVRHFTD